ncbi:MAG: hypothetical protein M1450_04310 [Patescibacteria group bacterium]|nr:hypothetical protein [Actinomycetota bacterium]MCL5970694.1 hypothetical protein [Patescibacteria group bacterium]
MQTPVDLPNIRNVTVSGRIGTGQTTLATGLAEALGWKLLEGGVLFEEFHRKMGMTELQVNNRPDTFDLDYEKYVKKLLSENSHQVIQSHLAGFDAQNIPGVFKILVMCENTDGTDKREIRIDRLVNRRGISIEEAKHEVTVREQRNLEKWRRLYAPNDPDWVYWDKKYYDLAINTYSHDKDEALKLALEAIGYK